MKLVNKRKSMFYKTAIAIWMLISAAVLATGCTASASASQHDAAPSNMESSNLSPGDMESQIQHEETDMDGDTDDSQEKLLFKENIVSYGGRTYRKNTYIKAILCLGIDRSGTMEEMTTTGFGGQADGIVLLAHDTARDTIKLLMIPRDTMTKIIMTDLSGNVLGKDTQHLTLAYAYGDGREKSCEYMAEAVSELLGGITIDHYFAADIDTISIVNDLAGGVTVTVPSEGMESADPAFVYGSTITLHGKQAEKFVRYRDTDQEHSALYRMDRQQEYILKFAEAVKRQAQKEEGLVPKLFEAIENYTVTDMQKAEYLKAAMSGLKSENLTDDGIYTLPGQGITTAKYDEFYPDEEGMKQVILELFYREEK